MSNSQNKYVEFQPTSVVDLYIDPGGKHAGFMWIKNILDTPVIFRFYSSKRKDPPVHPDRGILLPKQKKQVKITYEKVKPKHKEETLKVIVVLTDDRFLNDLDAKRLIKRTATDSRQEHTFDVKFHPNANPGIVEEQDGALITIPVREATESDFSGEKVIVPVPALVDRSSSGAWEEQDQREMSHFHPASAAYNRRANKHHLHHREHHHHHEREQHHDPTPEEKEIAKGSHGKVPHYRMKLGLEEEEPEHEFSVLLMKRISNMGRTVRRLGDDAHDLRHNQKFTMAVFFLATFLIVLLFWFLVVLPVWTYKTRRVTVTDSLGVAAAELGELFVEDRKGMTLDEYIHSRMN